MHLYKAATFLRDCDRYELEVASRCADLPGITATPYLASIDQESLASLIFMGDLDEMAPDATIETLREEEEKEYIKSIVAAPTSGYYPSAIEQAPYGLKTIPMKSHTATNCFY